MTNHPKQSEKIKKLREGIVKAANRCLEAVSHVAMANYVHREREADEMVEDAFDSLRTVLAPYFVDTGEPENPYHSAQCSDNLNPQANCFNEGAKAARAKFVSIGEIYAEEAKSKTHKD